MFGPRPTYLEDRSNHNSNSHAAEYGPEPKGADNAYLGTPLLGSQRLRDSASAAAGYNAPVRIEALHSLQQTHGNRATQRSLGRDGARNAGGSDRRVAVQRDIASMPGPTCTMEDELGLPNASAAPAGSSPYESPIQLGDANNAVSAATTGANMAMMGSPLFNGLPKLAEDFNIFSLAKGGSSALNTGTSALGVGLGLYNFINADNTADRVQAGADTLASGAGFLGPYGMAFSGGYSAGQLLDKGADWIGGKIWGEGDHSLHHGLAEHVLPHILPSPQSIRDGWDTLWGRGTEAERENAENRKFQLELDRIREARIEKDQKARDEQEMAEMHSQTAHPHVGGTMLGSPGDALSGSAIAARYVHPEVDEDGVPLPPVSMALQPRRR